MARLNKDIADQFAVILDNFQNLMVPYLDFYKDLETVIDHPNEETVNVDFDLLSHTRKIEHCLLLNQNEMAKNMVDSLMNNNFITLRIPISFVRFSAI